MMAKPPERKPRRGTAAPSRALVPVEVIQRQILVVRGQKVMLDADLAELYGVTTGRLVEAVRRNLDRFPDDCAPRRREWMTFGSERSSCAA